MKCTTSQGQFLKWSEKHEDLRFVDKSVEIIKQFQHYIGSAGGGGGNRTRKFVSEFRTLLNLVSIEESISAKKIENPEVTAFE